MFRWSAPLVSFPTTLVFIDDVPSFTEGLQFEIDPHSNNTKTFDNPHQGLDFLLTHQLSVFEESLTDVSRNNNGVYTIRLNIPSIVKTCFNPNRFETVSIVVVDYMMPGLNGLEICNSIRNKPYKKILLTGAADEKMAINAFNTGLIDRFIRKDDRNFSHLFATAIRDLQCEYFMQATNLAYQALLHLMPEESALHVPSYNKVFSSILEDEPIKEHYLLDEEGSHLCFSYEGKPSVLKIYSKKNMDAFLKMAEENNAPERVIKRLNGGSFLPFHIDEEIMNSSSSWFDHLYPCETLGNDFYFSYIDDTKAFRNFGNDILPFKTFMKEQA